MTVALVITFVGRDRPGLVNAISHAVAEHGGSWLESRLAHLAGEFAGIVRADAPDDRADALAGALRALPGLAVTVSRGGPPATEAARSFTLELIGLDRPGIVRDATRTLTDLGCNIVEFESGLDSAPFSGDPMFRASARIEAPEGVGVDALRQALERLAGEIMADINVSEAAKG
jgi:glycine cleavage system regulatory protein